ncbi:MAG: hypothetical protein KKE02_07370 [Alphaproteobacteria bacterium]|nr:hypothetical protein [Alphaproteobacteria bacterium]MBU1512599.1 hypothetical protein [Alphaproteobacteria bacterium]MBU2092938.1 hypothetical protein [Alphaproteobacteria bacterium]MBU2150823.1 hypothetical protein [Alphaproteobacteria bacterium]MBU2307965.1 hypothetical protein [Alphaproteobacteria bacterium]
MNWTAVLSRAATSLAALSLAASTPALAKSPLEPAAAAKPRSQCFWTRQVNSFASDDDSIVNVRVGVKDVYQMEMFGRCTDVDWNNSIALVSRGGSQICTGMDAEIISPSPIGPQRCPVSKIRKLTPDEIKALPKHARP